MDKTPAHMRGALPLLSLSKHPAQEMSTCTDSILTTAMPHKNYNCHLYMRKLRFRITKFIVNLVKVKKLKKTAIFCNK
jgi:hypothetical protein